MNEKIKNSLFAVFVDLLLIIVGGITGYNICSGVRSSEVAELTAKYDEAKRERDATVGRITEDNQRLRDGIERAEARLNEAEARVVALEEYNRSAGDRNQSLAASVSRTGQDLDEASRIVGGYLGE